VKRKVRCGQSLCVVSADGRILVEMKQTSQSKIVVVGVNYETDALALRFVSGLSRIALDANVVIVLVDNSERADSTGFFSAVRARYPDVLCVKSPANLGYFGGANLGLRAYLATGQDFDWLVVSNVDVEFLGDDFAVRLADLWSTEDIGVIAPSIWSSVSRCDLNPKMLVRPGRARIRLYTLLYRSFCLLNAYGLSAMLVRNLRYLLKNRVLTPIMRWLAPLQRGSRPDTTVRDSAPKSIYAPQGACIIFSKLFFLRGGSLDYPMFLFGEEIYVAETARVLGLRVVYDPRLTLRHDDHRSTGIMRSRAMASHAYESAVYIADTYFGSANVE
jgi:GT2 family glycosyltransferase